MSQANQPATPPEEFAESMESLRGGHVGWLSVVTDTRQRDWREAFMRTAAKPIDPDSVELDPLTVL